MTSFYDWYADLPVASPQVFGDQTDVPESGRLVGRHVPDDVGLQRSGHPHAGRSLDGRGALPRAPRSSPSARTTPTTRSSPTSGCQPRRAPTQRWPWRWGTSCCGVPRRPQTCRSSATTCSPYTDLPFLVRLSRAPDGGLVPGKFLTAADLGDTRGDRSDAVEDGAPGRTSTGMPVVPNGSMGFRYAESGVGQVESRPRRCRRPALSCADVDARLSRSRSCCPCFESPDGRGSRAAPRGSGPPRRRPPGHHRLRPDARPVRRRTGRSSRATGRAATTTQRRRTPLPGRPRSPAFPAEACIRIAREFAANAEESGGRSMIIMGAGICQWFHGDATYRAILALLMLTGCMGRNGGGWAHYVGQEKCRPITGWLSLANALDWSRPPRTMIGTAYWYMHTDQWRYDGYRADALASPLARGAPRRHAHRRRDLAVGAAGLDALLPAVRPQPARPRGRGAAVPAREAPRRPRRRRALQTATSRSRSTTSMLPRTGRARSCCGERTCWARRPRATSTSSSTCSAPTPTCWRTRAADESDPTTSPGATKSRRESSTSSSAADFRMTSTTLLSDVVFPAATWYEKHDLSTTDMHPFVHAFTPAIDPPWEAKSDFDTFHSIAQRLLRAGQDAPRRSQGPGQRAACSTTPRGRRRSQAASCATGGAATSRPCPARPCRCSQVVERDYTAIADKLAAVGPLADSLGLHHQERHLPAERRGRAAWPGRTA